MKVVSVNVVMTYPVHWTKYQVLRDFVQNFYDAIVKIPLRKVLLVTLRNVVE